MATHKEALERAVIKWFDGNKSFVEEWHSEQLEAALRAYLDAMDAVIVPREATDAMHNAARDWSDTKYGRPIGIDASKGCYEVMLAAAANPFRERGE